MQFGRPMQNDMLMMINKSKPEAEFKYGSCLFSETEPEVVISQPSKFAVHIGLYFDLLKHECRQ